MANTTKVNNTKRLNTSHIECSNNGTIVNANAVKKMKICQIFTRFTYANVIIGAILYLITIAVLFEASTKDNSNWWLGFWHQTISEEAIPPPNLSTFAIIVIVFDCLWFTLYIAQFIGNLILHNKVSLSYVSKILIALFVTILIMLLLGASCKPKYTSSSEFYISWMRLIKNDNNTVLTFGGLFILFEMILVYLGCIAYITYYYISKAKKIGKQDKKI